MFDVQILKRGCGVNDRDGLTDMSLLHYCCKAGAPGIGEAFLSGTCRLRLTLHIDCDADHFLLTLDLMFTSQLSYTVYTAYMLYCASDVGFTLKIVFTGFSLLKAIIDDTIKQGDCIIVKTNYNMKAILLYTAPHSASASS